MAKKVAISKAVKIRLETLVFTLFEKGYFAVWENAEEYVAGISDFMFTVPDKQCYSTLNKKYGKLYCQYKPNKRTTWYIIFDHEDDLYVIRHLINNHTKEYVEFIKNV